MNKSLEFLLSILEKKSPSSDWQGGKNATNVC